MNYTAFDMDKKVTSVLANYDGTVSLSEDELNNLFKEYFSKELENNNNTPITGVGLDLLPNKADLYINLKASFLKIGSRAEATIALDNDNVIITPTKFWIGRIPFSADTVFAILRKMNVQLDDSLNADHQLVINIKQKLPSEITVSKLTIDDNSLSVTVMPNMNVVSTMINSVVNKINLDANTTKIIAETFKKYTNNQIDSKTYSEITAGKISNETINIIISVIQNMDPAKQKEMFNELTKNLDSKLINQIEAQLGNLN